MNNAPCGTTIKNVAKSTGICLLNNMAKALKLAKKLDCLDFRVFGSQVAPPEEQVEAAAAGKQQLTEALVGIEMQKFNYFIDKPFANGFCVLDYSKLKM